MDSMGHTILKNNESITRNMNNLDWINVESSWQHGGGVEVKYNKFKVLFKIHFLISSKVHANSQSNSSRNARYGKLWKVRILFF